MIRQSWWSLCVSPLYTIPLVFLPTVFLWTNSRHAFLTCIFATAALSLTWFSVQSLNYYYYYGVVAGYYEQTHGFGLICMSWIFMKAMNHPMNLLNSEDFTDGRWRSSLGLPATLWFHERFSPSTLAFRRCSIRPPTGLMIWSSAIINFWWSVVSWAFLV